MTAEAVPQSRFAYDAANAVDPLGDADQEAEKGTKHNRAKVGSGRPSSLLYTYGPRGHHGSAAVHRHAIRPR